MKIVECINAIQRRGGAEVFATSLACSLKNIDNDVYFISLFSVPNKSLKKGLDDENIKNYYCNKTKGIDKNCARQFKELVMSINPDIIHIHLSVLPTYFLAFGTKKQKWKIIITLHNIYKKESGFFERSLRHFFIEKKNIHFVGISNEVTKSCPNLYRKCITTINNGFEPFSYDSGAEKKYDFVCVARFSPQKNHSLLLKAFRLVVEDHKKASLLLVGGGELLEEAKKLCTKLNLDDNVTFVGYANNVSDYLASSKTFVLSSFYEGNPISILEALYVGLPIIAPKVGGIPDIVKNNESGFLYKVNSLDELSLLMKNTLDNEQQMNSIGNYNKDYSKRFFMEDCAKKYHELFNALREGCINDKS